MSEPEALDLPDSTGARGRSDRDAAVFTLPGALARAASIDGDRPAVVGDVTLTYGELDGLATGLAARLREIGIRRGDRVAIWADKSTEAVTALYGVMRAGAAYVPIDPASPPRRAGRIIADAACAALCVDAKHASRLGDLGTTPPVVGLGSAPVPEAAFSLPDVDPVPGAATNQPVCEADLAYILYTSGSTGAPKGVMLTHRNALSFVEWTVDRFGVRADDILTNHAPFHFDLSVFDLFGAALTGATLHLVDAATGTLGAETAAFVERTKATVWYSVPSALVLLSGAARPEQLESLRVVLFAGEPFPIKHLRRLRDLVPHALLANLYGPTETNVCTYHVVPDALPEDLRALPIGRACENQEVFALDDQLAPADEGDVGELWVRGPTVMKGYWGDPERTAASLRQNPLQEHFPDPCYRTGDLVRPLPNGDLEFLGRRDHQVKSRGYRIDLGEIETALVAHEAILEAAVIAVPDEAVGNVLVAVLATDRALDPLDVKRHCADHVPRYMIPGEIVMRTQLPHTSTGKIDRQLLAEVAAAHRAGGAR